MHKHLYFRCFNAASSAMYFIEDEDAHPFMCRKARRREAHKQAEQNRRNCINKGYHTLQELVLSTDASECSGYKLCKNAVLERSIECIQNLQNEKKAQEEKRNALSKEIIALRIIQSNYQQIVKEYRSQKDHLKSPVSDEMKFSVFRGIMDQLFLSFSSVSVRDFSGLSAGVFSWLEEYCNPQNLKEAVYHALSKLNIQACA